MVASIVFLGLLAPNPFGLLPLIGFLLLGYAGIVLWNNGGSRRLMFILVAVIATYAWLKKYTIFPEKSFIKWPYFTLGLSYVFFRVVHLIVEAAEDKEKRRISFGAYLLYNLNFTTFISGPIQRYDEFARDQFASEPLPLGLRQIGAQLERIILGFFKVNVLAMLVLMVQEEALGRLQQSILLSEKLATAFLLSVAYPFFLYLNFSGYIDIVIGLARLMRVRLPENFDRPFSASSFLDFWNRWHITLSNWLKTYVFNPLLIALMRRISSTAMHPLLGVFCFFVTFFLIGIWHGRTSEFVMFGALQGGGVALNKLWQLLLSRSMGSVGYRNLAKNPIYIAFGRGLTFSWFAFSLFWFWADWKQIDRIFGALEITQWLCVWLAVWLCATVGLALWERVRAALVLFKTSEGPLISSRYVRVVFATALGLVSLVITVAINQPTPVIVYKTF
jgi:D-alanyl-lipoteichoic acid acyltransferase DltB (MBOAT superfamily)